MSGALIASTAYSSFGEPASWRRSSVYLLAGWLPATMWQDTPASMDSHGRRTWVSQQGRHIPVDIDAIITEVAAAVGLAEGEAGVRDILRVVARDEPVPTASISRAAELPVPIVTAVCGELRRRGPCGPDRRNPAR